MSDFSQPRALGAVMGVQRNRQAAFLALVMTLLIGAASPSAQASRSQRSIFQDDNQLVFQSPADTGQALDTLRYLGVNTIRVSVFWDLVAPASTSTDRPSFDASNPAQYPTENWARYDQVVTLAQQRGINVDFNIGPPIPKWAAGMPENTNFVGHFRPSASEFGQFVRALGRRYAGGYVANGRTLPRVSFWSLWNEPNHMLFLGPQYARSANRSFEAGAKIYRSLVDEGYRGLGDTGHGGDTFLIGETANQGLEGVGDGRSLRPLRFIRALYCVDGRSKPLRGTAASVEGCPTGNQPGAFRAAHPGLFGATGWGHHPYQLLLAPTVRSSTDSVSTADIPRLTGTLDRAFAAYGQHRRIPIYFDEYGYETKPPARFGVSLAKQAAYLNQAEYMAYHNPRVRAYSQFLLRDNTTTNLLQSGLMTKDGAPKPAFNA